MDNILLLDTSIATDNIGDDIIMECTRKELAPILSKSFVRNLPTHVSPFHWYQVMRKSNALMSFANSKLKFVGGSNILIPNLLTHYPQWNINIFNYQPLKGCILVGVGAGAQEPKTEAIGTHATFTAICSILIISIAHATNAARNIWNISERKLSTLVA